jgi:serine/threonine-protein kinase
MDKAPGRSYERLVGRYALYGEIASGGMATVHFGRLLGPVGFSRTVAIKRLHAQFAKDPEFAAMFLDEARLAGRIQHPNVVSTLDVVALDDELFLVMEYVQGESLSKLLGTVHRRSGQIPPKVVAAIMTGVLYGLHAAHEATDERGQPLHIVHRDVSPQNVIVGSDGTARVLDFGVAKAVGRIQSTREGEIKGKLAYMAPEQMKGGAMDRRTDIYGAAVVLWEALTARRLFDGEHAGVVFTRVMAGDVAPPSRVMPGIPPALDEIVARGLALDPNVRYPTARAFAMDLEDRVGIASPRQVGEWLAEIAGEALSKRAVRVKEIESISTPPPMLLSSLAPGAGPPSVSGIPAPRSSNPTFSDAAARPPPPSFTPSPPPSFSPNSAGPAPLSAPDLSFGGAPVLADASTASGASSRLQASSITVSPGASSPGPLGLRNRWIPLAAGLVAAMVGAAVAFGLFRGGDPTPTASAVQSDSPAPTSSAPSPAVSPELPVSAAPAPSSSASASAPAASARPPSKPAGKVTKGGDCNPPFTIDAKGIRRLKPQCL